MSVDRNVLVASHDATIRAMIVINNFVGDQALLTAGDDLALRNFRLPECQENPTKYGEEESHMGAVTTLGFYKDHLFTGSGDSVIKIWDRSSWECLLTLEGHTGAITGLVGMVCLPELPEPYETVVSSASDGTVRVWHILKPNPAGSPAATGPEEQSKQTEIEKKAASALADPNCPAETKARVTALIESLRKAEQHRKKPEAGSMSARCVCVHQFGTPVTCLGGMPGSTKVVAGFADGTAHCLDAEVRDHRGIVQSYEHDGLWESLGDASCITVTPREADVGHVTVVADRGGLMCAWGALTGVAVGCTKLEEDVTALCSVGPECVAVGTSSGSVHLWRFGGIGAEAARQGIECIARLASRVGALEWLPGKDAMGYSIGKLYASVSKGSSPGGVYLVGTEEPLKEMFPKEALYDAGCCGEEAGMVDFITEAFEAEFGEPPATLRHDFCGTARLALLWCQEDDGMEALGVEADPDMLSWARREHSHWMKQDVTELMAQGLSLLDARRSLHEQEAADLPEGTLRLVQHDLSYAGDVPASCQGFDVVTAIHYQGMSLRDRSKLLGYLKRVHRALNPKGIFVMDLYGGPGAAGESEDELGSAFVTRKDTGRLTRFDTVWEQTDHDPATRGARCCLHFRFGDGSEIEEAYCYELVLWEIEELREAFTEAGFKTSKVFMETVEEGAFTGEYEERAYPVYSDQGPNWYQAMLVARKGE